MATPLYHCTTRVFTLGDYPICKFLIWRLHAIRALPFQPTMLWNTCFEYDCIFCKPSWLYPAGQILFRRETFPFHSVRSSCRRRSKYQVRMWKNNNPKCTKNNNAHQQLDQVETIIPIISTTCCINDCCTDWRSIFLPSWWRRVELKLFTVAHQRNGCTRSKRRKRRRSPCSVSAVARYWFRYIYGFISGVSYCVARRHCSWVVYLRWVCLTSRCESDKPYSRGTWN